MAETAEAPTETAKGKLPAHLEKYKFGPGNNANPAGNPHLQRQKQNQMALLRAVTPEVATKLILDLVQIAGDPTQRARDRVSATDLVLKYTVCPPAKNLNVQVTTTTATTLPTDLTADEVSVLESIRQRLTLAAQSDPPDEVIIPEPPAEPA